MSTPPFLITAALIFWGWHTGLLYIAITMAALAELARVVPFRWDFSTDDINRVSDLCTIALAIGVVIALNSDARHFVLITIRWLPVILFPLILVQVYGKSAAIRLSALLMMLRKKKIGYRLHERTVNLSYPYLCICVIATAAANGDKNRFYGALLVFTGWALWPLRPKRYPALVWILLLITCGVAGFGIHTGLYRLQTYIMNKAYDLFYNEQDPFQRITAIGDVRSLKPSNRILFRVVPDAGQRGPLLLQESCYTLYEDGKWYATFSGFNEISPQPDKTTWIFTDTPQARNTAQVLIRYPEGKHLLKIPDGTFKLSSMDALSLYRNRFGVVRIESPKGLMRYRVHFAPHHAVSDAPGGDDLQIPEQEKAALQKIITRLDLKSKNSTDALLALKVFFSRDFRYSLDLGSPGSGNITALAHFLMDARKGHCEYFATATALLLRAADIPARYVSGYAAVEYSDLEKMIIVRQRHAHAWAQAYVAGKWIDVDNTPPDWSAIESANSSPFGIVSDFFSYIRFHFQLWREDLTQEQLTRYLIVPLIILLILFVKRLTGKKDMKRVRRQKKSEPAPTAVFQPESPFHAVEKWLHRQGFEKESGETTQQYLARIDRSAPDMMLNAQLAPYLSLHYRNLYSQLGLTPAQRQTLVLGVREVLSNLERTAAQ